MSNLSELLPAGSGAKVAEFVASGTLASGQAVALRSDGKVEAIAVSPESVGSAVVFEAAASASIASTFDSASNKVVIAYKDAGNSNYGTSIVGTVSGSSISFGTPTIFASTEADNIAATFDSANNKAVIAFRRLAGSDPGRAVVGTVSGTSISFGGQVEFNSGHSRSIAITYDSSSEKVVVAYEDVDNSRYGTAAVGTVSGTSISFGSEAVFSTNIIDDIGIAYDSGANKVVIAYRDNGNNEYGTAIVGTVSGTSMSFGTAVAYTNFISRVNSVCYDSTNAKIVIAFHNQTSASYAIVGTVSGTSISFGSSVVFNAAETGDKIGMVYVPTTQKIVITYRDVGNSNYGTLVNATVSGTSISFSSELVFSASSTSSPVPASTADGKVAIAYADSSNYGTGVVYSSTSSNNTDFVGITNAAISNSATGEVVPQGGVITNSNFLPPVYTPSSGTPVVFEAGDIGNSNGLPSVAFDSNSNKIVIAYTDVANSNQGTVIVGTVSGTSISYGTAVVFETGITSFSSAVFDSSNNKIVIAYRDGGDSNYGKAIVGTVSGTSISFGTAVTFETANSDHISATFDSNSNKVVIAYRDDGNSNYGTAIVGTVSGTSISFGTAVVYASVNAQSKSIAFDSNLNKLIIAFRNFNNAGYSWAVVGTVSGTSISFGTTVAYSSTATEHLSVIFDSSNNKAVLTARDSNNKGIAVVGTVSGTSISFGSAVIYSGSSTADWGFAVFDAAANKVVISYSDLSNSSRGTVIVGTVSGTGISFGTPVVFNNAGDTNYIGSGFDSNLNKVVTAYQDANNSNYGTSVVVTITGASPALTIGTDYFVQTDGTLSTTTSTVPAGRALSATSILLEG